MDWEGDYDPGRVVAVAIDQRGILSPNILWEKSDAPVKNDDEGEDDPLAMDTGEDVSSEKEKQKKLPVQFVLEGELQVFSPHVEVPASMIGLNIEDDYLAEVHLHLKLVDNFTQRIISQKYFWAVGHGGIEPFPNTEESLIPGHPDFQKTSMGHAIENLTEKIFQYLSGFLNEIPLDSQVLFVDEDQETVTLNVGRKHGVKIGDEFTIYKLTPNLEDPITGADLGDHFKRLGAVRVSETGEGFSEAVLLVGTNLKRGLIARGEKFPINVLDKTGQASGSDLAAIESNRPFEDLVRERNYPRGTITSFDFFSILGFELGF
ncbi:MAG: hypothetical protein G3M70_16190 [Candidatus Nitronauta litoralis]|uniref:Uncharacterized protein n=1 Tax=Candidatus Nitronauta litoralis TaxID=2705533 RepID=A0A7T0BYN9_9BACT|nr:MAG: hypothetical protein G3M70_16190 [Candidatus Nitronauta litoralis]